MKFCDTAETQRIGNSHLRKVSVSESNVLLDEEVLTDPKIQALLLTVLVRKFELFRRDGGILILDFYSQDRYCSRPRRSNTPPMTSTRGFCTSTWLKQALSSQRCSPSCKSFFSTETRYRFEVHWCDGG